MKALIYEPQNFSKKAIKLLKDNGIEPKLNPGQDFKDAVNEYEIIYMRLGKIINKSVFNRNMLLKYLVIPATGIDHVNEDDCRKFKVNIISFKNNKELISKINATPELTIALCFNLLRKITSSIKSVQNGIWDREKYRGYDLENKSVGIIGFGRIGKKMAKIYSSFGCRVSFYDISNLDENKKINRYDNLEDIFKNSDIISLHASYSNENHEMINYKLFSLCKPSSIFINTARGGLVCEKSMIKALVNKKIAGAAIDVISEENNFNKNNHLVKYINNNDNLIITPHLGGCTFESSEKAELAITKHFLTYLK